MTVSAQQSTQLSGQFELNLARQIMRQVRTETKLPTVFAAVGNSKCARIVDGLGLRTDRVRGVDMIAGEGLGGLALNERRLVSASNYGESQTRKRITSRYDENVAAEGWESLIALPVLVRGDVRMVLWGARHELGEFGDDAKRAFEQAAQNATVELRIHDEVERRLSMAEVMGVQQSISEFGSADRESLRTLYADLRKIALDVDSDEIRERLLEASQGLSQLAQRPDAAPEPSLSRGAGRALETGLGSGARPLLTEREIDVLSFVALGCTNKEVATHLGLSAESVKVYLRNCGLKLEASGRIAIVNRARSLGLIP